jgi:hypothetical protein
MVKFDDDNIIVRHNRNRSFKLYRNAVCVTNLPTTDLIENVWVSHEIHINSTWAQSLHSIDTDNLPADTSLSVSQAIDQISNLLDTTVHDFYQHNFANIQLYYSGGIDTLLIYSLLTHNNKSFDLIPYIHYDQDYFTTKNQNALSSLWSYNQIHHWRDSAWIATGSHGDEYFLRGPEVISMITSWHDINFVEVMANNPNSYHSKYFAKYPDIWNHAWENRREFQDTYPTQQAMHQQILNFLLNDHQYWHFGNTMTWTPFKNIELVRILLQCSIEDLLPQFINAELSKQLINRSDPNLLTALSRYKNFNSSENVMLLLNHNKNLLQKQ